MSGEHTRASRDLLVERDAVWGPMRALRGAKDSGSDLVYRLLFRALSKPFYLALWRTLFRILRQIRPVARIFNFIIPARHRDIREALTRQEDFNLAEEMTARMPDGPVSLSIDWPERHRQERIAVQQAFEATRSQASGDYDHLRQLVVSACNRQIPDNEGDLTLNVARDLTEEVALDVAIHYFGIGLTADREHLRTTLRRLASLIFRAPRPRSEAAAEIEAAKSHLAEVSHVSLAQAKAAKGAPTASDTVLRHLVHQTSQREAWMDEDWARRNAATLAVFGTATTARAMTHALFWIFRLDGAPRVAEAAAEAYFAATEAEKPERRRDLLKIVLEALRFSPMLPILGARYSLRDTMISLASAQRTEVKAGQVVLASPLAAMFDPEVFPNPHRFCPHSRQFEDFMHFGHGPHICIGKRQAEIQFEEVLAALFRVKNLRVLGGRGEHIAYDGPAVDKLVVTTRV